MNGIKNPWRLDGRTALVTGASRGIGKAVAEALGERGAEVWLMARGPETLESAVAEINDRGYTAHAVSGNISVAGDGIRVNAVAPWYIETPLAEQVLADPDYLTEVLARTPLRRIGRPEEVAATIAFLCMPGAGYITEQVIPVDGGSAFTGSEDRRSCKDDLRNLFFTDAMRRRSYPTGELALVQFLTRQ